MEALLALYYFGSSLVTGGGGISKQDGWLCIIIGTGLAVALVWIYSAVLELYPGRNFYDNIIRACGKIPGKILVALLCIYMLLISGQVLRNESEFIHIINLKMTPLVVILTALIGGCIYILSHRIFALARIAKFIAPFIFVFISLTVVLSIRDWNPSNLKPFLGSGFSSIAGGSLLVLSLPFGESVICAPLFGQLDPKAKSYPVFVKGILLGASIMLAASFRNILVLGYSDGAYMFPSYSAVSVIAVGEFFTRFEVLININLLLAGLFKVAVIIYALAESFAKLFCMKDYEPLVASCALLMFTDSLYWVKNTQEISQVIHNIPMISFPFQIVIPLIALIVGKLRNRLAPKEPGSGSSPKEKSKLFRPRAKPDAEPPPA
jgi:spore germination protein KB